MVVGIGFGVCGFGFVFWSLGVWVQGKSFLALVVIGPMTSVDKNPRRTCDKQFVHPK